MKENVLDVLIYLFENYMFDSDELEPDQETLVLELSQAGFEHEMIDRAFEWLENLAVLCENNEPEIAELNRSSIRHYCPEEQQQINVETQSLLMKLEQCGVLNSASREMVIDQLMALGVKSIELDHVKWVIMMVLSNFTDDYGVSELTESLVLDGLHNWVH